MTSRIWLITIWLLYTFLLCIGGVFPLTAHASLTTDLSENELSITAGFTGASVVLFGMTDQPDGDLIVHVQGPKETEVIRRKVNTFGLWLNRDSMMFNEVPGYYDISSSNVLDRILPREQLHKNGFGINNLTFAPEGKYTSQDRARFNEALIQAKQIQGLFSLGTNEITYIGPQLFRTRIWLPPTVPIGPYQVTTYLIRDNLIIDSQVNTLTITQAGISGFISRLSKQHSLFYGLMAVFIAVFAGWLSNEIFKRE